MTAGSHPVVEVVGVNLLVRHKQRPLPRGAALFLSFQRGHQPDVLLSKAV